MPPVRLNGREYDVAEGEFPVVPHAEYNNLEIRPRVGELERLVGLLADVAEAHEGADRVLYVTGWRAGGFVPREAAATGVFSQVAVDGLPASEAGGVLVAETAGSVLAIFVEPGTVPALLPVESYILCQQTISRSAAHHYKVNLVGTDFVLCVPDWARDTFKAAFRSYFDESGAFQYDNLIHLCIMVKNAGPLFEQVLTENLAIVDRWTVLDTGSTDGTQDVVRRVLGAARKGELHEEPFINFRDSRNRCLELAGRRCKYTLMLDDTYVVRGDLRAFLNTVRGDQFATSYSLLIRSDDTEYYSNRIVKTAAALRYMYTIHEVIQQEGNTNVVIPKAAATIHDYRAPYMEKRTMERKRYDIQCLEDMLREDPGNPRHMYYMAQTYNVLEDWENAAKWFRARAEAAEEGFLQERIDAWFELARLYNFKLERPWPEAEAAYLKAYELDPSRPDALYFVGLHYDLVGDWERAFDYFKRGFQLGYPVGSQFSLRPTIAYHFLPKFLAPLCYRAGDAALGLEATRRYMEHAADPIMVGKTDPGTTPVMASWHAIFEGLVRMPAARGSKPLVAFVADGGWGPWLGRDILTKGMGGSETWVVEMARWIQAAGRFDCVVFCNTGGTYDVFEGVVYRPLSDFYVYAATVAIHTCIVSRYSEYVPVALKGTPQQVHLILHDLGPTGLVIPMEPKLKKVICLSNWHAEFFKGNFPQLADRTEAFYYGIDVGRFDSALKRRHSFIYSSFPNRGLLQLLRMWPSILAMWPDATLDIYSDIEGAWVNKVDPGEMEAVKILIKRQMPGITLHGWVSKAELAAAWRQADIWLYPATFQETFCLTALEAAAAGCLTVAPPLAALRETAAHGILVTGDARDASWHRSALAALAAVDSNPVVRTERLAAGRAWAAVSSWQARAAEFEARYLVGG